MGQVVSLPLGGGSKGLTLVNPLFMDVIAGVPGDVFRATSETKKPLPRGREKGWGCLSVGVFVILYRFAK